MASCTYNPGIDDSNPYAVLTVTESSYDVSSNTSVVSWNLKLYRPYNISSSTAKSYSVVVNGSTVASGTTTIGGSGTKTIASGTKTVSHNADGSKSISFSFALDFKITWSGTYIGTGKASGSLALTTIPRASQPSLITYPDSTADVGEFGDTISIHMNRNSSAFTHTVRYEYGNLSGVCINAETGAEATGITNGFKWKVPESFMNLIPNTTTGSGRIYVDTYNGSTLIGTKYTGFTATVPASIKPSIGSVTISEATDGLADKFGLYIQYKSKLKVVTAASGSYSSTIKSYAVKILGRTYSGSTITSNTLDTSGSVSVAVTVTDSRGRTATSTSTVTVVAYADPTIATFTAQRCESDGTLSEEGEYVKFTFAFDITALSNKNDKSYTIAYKLKSASSFTTLTSGSAYSLDTTYIPTTVFSGDTSYDFRLTVSDYFNSVSFDSDIPTAFTLEDYHSSGTGKAIGKVSEKENTFEVALDAEFTKALKAKKGIFIEDTRDVNLTPDEYRALGRGVYFEFKTCSAVALSDTSNTYCTVVTFVQWNNTSGGSIKQMLLDNDRVWYRYGDSTSWGSWKPLLYRMAWQSVENGVSYKIQDGMCTVRGNSNTTLSISPSGVVACTLPAIAWPTVELFGTVTTKANVCGQVSIGTDGKVTLWNLNTTSTYWAFTITYPID